MTLPVRTLPLVIALAATLALSACGRRGPLEPPPSAEAQNKGKETTTITESVPNEDAFANQLGRPAKNNRAITIPKQDFILDPLL